MLYLQYILYNSECKPLYSKLSYIIFTIIYIYLGYNIFSDIDFFIPNFCKMDKFDSKYKVIDASCNKVISQLNFVMENYERYNLSVKNIANYLNCNDINFFEAECILRHWFQKYSLLYREILYVVYGLMTSQYHFNDVNQRPKILLPNEQLPISIQNLMKDPNFFNKISLKYQFIEIEKFEKEIADALRTDKSNKALRKMNV